MKMGIWDYISFSSTTDSIKRNAPDPTSLKSLYCSFYGYSRAAVEKLYPYLPDAETRSEIATNLAKQTATVAVREGAKLLPGGSMGYEIISRSIRLANKSKECKEVVQAFNKDTVMKPELNDCRRLLKQHEMQELIKEINTKKALHLNEKPEDIIRVLSLLTTTEFTGKQYLDDLIAPSPEVTPKEE